AFEPAGISAVPLWPALPVCERTSEEPPMRALSPLAFDILGDAAVFELREVPRNALVSTCLVSLALKEASGQLQVDAAWLDGVCRQAGLSRPSSVEWPQVRPAIRVLLLGCLLAGLLERLEMLFGDRPSLQAEARPLQTGMDWRRVALIPIGDMESQAACIWLDLPSAAMRLLPRQQIGGDDGFWRALTVPASLQA